LGFQNKPGYPIEEYHIKAVFRIGRQLKRNPFFNIAKGIVHRPGPTRIREQ